MYLFKINKGLIIFVLSIWMISCGCPGPGYDKAGIYSVDIKSYDTTYMYDLYTVQNEYERIYFHTVPITSRLIRNVDTLVLNFVFKASAERIAASTGFSLIRTAYACSPVESTYSLKYIIDSVVITSDTIYNSIEKGKSLNPFFTKTDFRGSIDDLVMELNREGSLQGSYYFNFSVATDKKSGIYTDQELFIKIYKSNGVVVEGSTGKFKWY